MPQSDREKSVVLLSGGLDSTVAAAIARQEGFALHALTIQYGQRHAIELEAARRVAKMLAMEQHVFTEVNLRAFGGSALTDSIDVPKSRTRSRKNPSAPSTIPITYVPARNTIFLSLALAYCEVAKAKDIFIGVNAIDYSGYPDCRPEFIQAFERLARLATKAGTEGITFRIHTPLIKMTKAEIIREGSRLGVDFAVTHSCYDPTVDGLACGKCDSCYLRRKGFEEAGVFDPTVYAANS